MSDDEGMVRASFDIPRELREQIRERARTEDRTVSAIVRRALRAYLATEDGDS